MTDTVSPITEPHLTPMFATGAQPALSPNTEPHPSPIFDTGPHPEPLRSETSGGFRSAAVKPEAAEPSSLEWDSDEWQAVEAVAWVSAQPDTDAAPAAQAHTDAAPVLDYERAPLWDAGSDSEPELARIARDLDAADAVHADVANTDVAHTDVAHAEVAGADVAGGAADPDPEPPVPHAPPPRAFSELENVDTDAFLRSVTGHLRPVAVSAQPVVVPATATYQFVKRWKFALIVAGVWLLAAAAGAGVYYWWYTALDKTLPVFGILLYLVVCMVASILVSMVPNRPQVTALAIALMSAPLASTAAAAVLHGAYFFEWITRPTIG